MFGFDAIVLGLSTSHQKGLVVKCAESYPGQRAADARDKTPANVSILVSENRSTVPVIRQIGEGTLSVAGAVRFDVWPVAATRGLVGC